MEPYTAIIIWREGGLRWSERMCWVPDDQSAIGVFKDQANFMRTKGKADAEVLIARRGKRVIFNG